MSAQILKHPAAKALNVKRAFESAGMHPALSHWISSALPPDVDIRAGLRSLRARAREAAQNDDHAKYYLRLIESNVIGHQGINIQAKPRLQSGAEDKRTAKLIEYEFTIQSRRGVWDSSGQLSRHDFDRLAVRTVAMDGECLIRVHEFDPDSPTGFSVELIDAEALDVDYNETLPNGNLIRMGVEMTPRRRPVAYHFFLEPKQPYSGYSSGYQSAERVRVPASEIIHVYRPEWAWGTRGVPWMHTALRRMKMLSGYEEAAITAARSAAVKSAAYVATPDYNPDVSPTSNDQFQQDLSPGAMEVVPPGWDLKPLDWGWPNTEHEDFVRGSLRGIASGLGVAYNSLANDLTSVNFSSLRQGALTERDLWMMLQSWWIEWVAQPIYERWLIYAVKTGRVSRNNGTTIPADRIPGITAATFQGRRWPWVDPVKDIQASSGAVALRGKSISQFIRETGRDPEEVWAELAQDLKELERLGIPLPTTPSREPMMGDPDTDDT